MADWVFDLEYRYQEEQNAVNTRWGIEYVLFETCIDIDYDDVYYGGQYADYG